MRSAGADNSATAKSPARTEARGLRILHLGKYYPPATGGIESHVQTLARAQAALGARVSVLCVNHADREGHDVTFETLGRTPTVEERDGEVRVIRLGRLGQVARFDLVPRLPMALASLLAEGVDVLHVHAPSPLMQLGALLTPKVGCLVVTHHSDVVRQKLLGAAFRPVELGLYARAAVVLSDSPQYQDGSAVLRRFLGKVRVLPLGVDLTPFRDPSLAARRYAERLKNENSGPLWLFVGRLVYYKGLETALRALVDCPGTLLIAGVGPLEATLRAQAHDLGVEDRVQWLGRLGTDELIGAYHAATALWFPSNARSEGYGLVQVEAMASGCPVINTDISGSGVPWVSQHDVSGLTVPVEDAAALARASQRLAGDASLRKRLAAGARKRALEEFDHLEMAVRSVTHYRNALANPART